MKTTKPKTTKKQDIRTKASVPRNRNVQLFTAINFLIAALDALGVELINQKGNYRFGDPIFIKCSYSVAVKLSDSFFLTTELCEENIWKIKFDHFPENFIVSPQWTPWSNDDDKEWLINETEAWLEMVIENNNT